MKNKKNKKKPIIKSKGVSPNSHDYEALDKEIIKQNKWAQELFQKDYTKEANTPKPFLEQYFNDIIDFLTIEKSYIKEEIDKYALFDEFLQCYDKEYNNKELFKKIDEAHEKLVIKNMTNEHVIPEDCEGSPPSADSKEPNPDYTKEQSQPYLSELEEENAQLKEKLKEQEPLTDTHCLGCKISDIYGNCDCIRKIYLQTLLDNEVCNTESGDMIPVEVIKKYIENDKK